MRLIDADRLIENLRKEIKDLENKPDSLAKEIAIKAAEFFIQDIQDINITPTAYDIDKVVEEIQDYSFRTFGEIRTETVIEIVKEVR